VLNWVLLLEYSGELLLAKDSPCCRIPIHHNYSQRFISHYEFIERFSVLNFLRVTEVHTLITDIEALNYDVCETILILTSIRTLLQTPFSIRRRSNARITSPHPQPIPQLPHHSTSQHLPPPLHPLTALPPITPPHLLPLKSLQLMPSLQTHKFINLIKRKPQTSPHPFSQQVM
jgi:hypothetical protein